MARTEEIQSVTVSKTGTVYKTDELAGKDLKDVAVSIKVSDDRGNTGVYEAHGWVEGGDVHYVVPEDRDQQLEANEAKTTTDAPSEQEKTEATRVPKTK